MLVTFSLDPDSLFKFFLAKSYHLSVSVLCLVFYMFDNAGPMLPRHVVAGVL